MLGIETLKEVTTSVLNISSAVSKSFEDGDYDKVGDSLRIGKALFQELPPVLKNGKQAIAELKDLNADEFDELATHIQESFDIENDELEEKIEQGLDQLVKLYEVITDMVAYGQTLKKAS